MSRRPISRRRVLAAGCTLVSTALAGCGASGDGGGGDDPGTGESADDTTTTGDGADDGAGYGGWLDETSNYDGVVDRTGRSEVTVDVGAPGNTGDFAFAPAAVRVSAGTTVVWEWTGDGGLHNVSAVEGATFRSQTVQTAGHAFSRTLDDAGVVKYECTPHATLGMKGVVEVIE